MEGKKWYKKLSNWFFILIVIILILFLSVNLYIMYQAKTQEDKVPSIFGYKPFIVLSGSMETEIHIGDLVITKEVDPKTLKKDDVIAFRDAENTVTTHRIIDLVDKDGQTLFITKGDNNNTQDQNLVEFDDVEGIYITRIAGVGTMMDNLSKPTTVVIMVLGISIIFFLLFNISNKKLRSQEEEEFLEYKRQKALQEKANSKDVEETTKKSETKKDTTKKKATKKTTSSKKSGKHS